MQRRHQKVNNGGEKKQRQHQKVKKGGEKNAKITSESEEGR